MDWRSEGRYPYGSEPPGGHLPPELFGFPPMKHEVDPPPPTSPPPPPPAAPSGTPDEDPDDPQFRLVGEARTRFLSAIELGCSVDDAGLHAHVTPAQLKQALEDAELREAVEFARADGLTELATLAMRRAREGDSKTIIALLQARSSAFRIPKTEPQQQVDVADLGQQLRDLWNRSRSTVPTCE